MNPTRRKAKLTLTVILRAFWCLVVGHKIRFDVYNPRFHWDLDAKSKSYWTTRDQWCQRCGITFHE